MRKWDIYNVTTDKTIIHGVKLRGRLRRFAIENGIELLTENATDTENTVRFAIEHGAKPDKFNSFLQDIISDSKVTLAVGAVSNPVLSKLKVNLIERY